MSITFENAMAALGLLGTGGLIGNYFQILWQRRSSDLSKQQEFKETRYKCVIILMYSCLAFDHQRRNLEKAGRHFDSQQQLLDELKTEWHNMLLFASDGVLKGVHTFIQTPNPATFKSAALAMRQDLWGGKLSPEIAALDFETVKPK